VGAAEDVGTPDGATLMLGAAEIVGMDETVGELDGEGVVGLAVGMTVGIAVGTVVSLLVSDELDFPFLDFDDFDDFDPFLDFDEEASDESGWVATGETVGTFPSPVNPL
jgi:hypothetical protein